MANLIVTFSRARDYPGAIAPVSVGRNSRTEQVAIPLLASGDTVGTLTANSDENLVELVALAPCWVAIGQSPEALAGACRYIPLGVPMAFWVSDGDAVAVLGV